VVAGVLAFRGDERHGPDVEMGPITPGEEDEGSLPAITVEADGWEVIDAQEDYDQPWDAGDTNIEFGYVGSLQVFRRPGQLAGPTIVVQHWPASDAVVPRSGEEAVQIGDRQGALHQVDDRRFTLSWNPPTGDSQGYLQAFDLTREQVIDFATGLEAQDGDIDYPPAADDQYGFEATVLPADIEEDPVGPLRERADSRRVELQKGSADVVVSVDDRGEMTFEDKLAGRLINGADVAEVSVEGRPALLVGQGQTWTVLWRHGDANVEVSITGAERWEYGEVDVIIDGLREISEEEWRDLREWAM
jgi:hypothetical protein